MKSVSRQCQSLIDDVESFGSPRSAGPRTCERKESQPPSGGGVGKSSAEPAQEDGPDGFIRAHLKTPQGSIDYGPADMVIRDSMMRIIKKQFNTSGVQQIETPVFELRQILESNYGEDEKLIFHLAKETGEDMCLRYDLTVPLARYCAMNRKTITNPFKAARIGRVYRRDTPRMTKGRMREFWQCDLDIVRTGTPSNPMDLVLDDAEVIAMFCRTLNALLEPDLGPNAFTVRVNNRKLLDAILHQCNVPPEKGCAISSAIDKMDKHEWDYIQDEMVDKGISVAQARSIRPYVEIKGSPQEVLERLSQEKFDSPKAAEALKQLKCLTEILKSYGVDQYIQFDMSMVRGLSYYTGVIMEANLTDPVLAEGVGSIAGGGRYDELVAKFIGKKDNKDDDMEEKSSDANIFPCVGASLGFERVFSVLKQKRTAGYVTSSKVLVVEVGSKAEMGLLQDRIRWTRNLRDAGLAAEYMPKVGPSPGDQFGYAESLGIPFCLIFGESELTKGVCNLKRMFLVGDVVTTKDKKQGTVTQIDTKDDQGKRLKWPQYHLNVLKKGKIQSVKVSKKALSAVLCGSQQYEFKVQEKGVPLDTITTRLKELVS